MKRWIARWAAWTANHHGLVLHRDDRSFVAMLTAWVILVAIVTYLLFGWEGAGAVIAVVGVFGIGTLAVLSRQHRREARKG